MWPIHWILCPLMKLTTDAISISSFSSLLYSLLLVPFSLSQTGPHINLHILFSKVLSFLSVLLVVVHASHPYVSVGFIIAVYRFALVFLENTFDFKKLLKSKAALSVFIILTSILLAQSLFLLSTAPRYRNSLTFSKVIGIPYQCCLSRIAVPLFLLYNNMFVKLYFFVYNIICK